MMQTIQEVAEQLPERSDLSPAISQKNTAVAITLATSSSLLLEACGGGAASSTSGTTYMDALSLPSIKSMMNIKVRLQPYIRTFIEVFASVPDGICWSSPNHNHALEAHVALQVFLTTV